MYITIAKEQIPDCKLLRDNVMACKEKYKLFFTEKQYLELPAKMTVDGKVYSKTDYIKQIKHEGKKMLLAVYLLD